MRKFIFYLLSVIWGLPMTLIGLLAALTLRIIGYRPNKYGWCYYFEVGNGWGGVSLGLIFITNKNPTTQIRNHEHGHALQNCIWGPLMPFIIAIPSAVRYWYREIRNKVGLENKTAYSDIWFEHQADIFGCKFMNSLEQKYGKDMHGDK